MKNMKNLKKGSLLFSLLGLTLLVSGCENSPENTTTEKTPVEKIVEEKTEKDDTLNNPVHNDENKEITEIDVTENDPLTQLLLSQ